METFSLGITKALASAWETALDAGDFTAWDAFVDKHPDILITLRGLDTLAMGILFAINKKNKQRNQRLDALEQRLAELEARPVFSDKGIWDGLTSYAVGDHVTTAGSYWACRVAHVSQKPGTDSTKMYWRLVSKAGTPGQGDPR